MRRCNAGSRFVPKGRRGFAVWTLAACSLGGAKADAAITGLQRVAIGVPSADFATYAPGDPTRLFIAGLGQPVDGNARNSTADIRILNLTTGALEPTPFLSITGLDISGEGGLLGLAFHPDYATNGKFYVNVTAADDVPDTPFSTYIREYTVSANPNVANPDFTPVLSFTQPQENHNGGFIGFSPRDKFLYIMTGDGGGGGDFGPGHTEPGGNAQDVTANFLGKALRIDVNGDQFPDPERNYRIPNFQQAGTNPFAPMPDPMNPGQFIDPEGDDELWAYGLRNPFRAGFDRVTGDLWIGDVGQAMREEIDFQAATSAGGENYGWRLREGFIETPGVGGPKPPGAIDPLYDYLRTDAPDSDPNFTGNTVIGGVPYRGPDPSLQGVYFFADLNGKIWTLRRPSGSGPVDVDNVNAMLPFTPPNPQPGLPVAISEDASGNLYVTYLTGSVYRIVTNELTPADFDADGDADGADFLRWQRNFGRASGATFADGDATGDGDVDGDDLAVWQREFGYSVFNAAGAAVVPEPGAASLLVAAMAAALVRLARWRAVGRRMASAIVRWSRALEVAALLLAALLAASRPAHGALAGLQRVASGLSAPIFATHAPGDPGRLYIVQRGGVIKILDLGTGVVAGTPFLTIPSIDAESEGGFLGLAFHPEYATNGKFYTYTTHDNGSVNVGGATSPFSTHIRQYTVSEDRNIANPAPTAVLSFPRPQANHVGGWIGFSPKDGYLYIASGDGGGGDDTGNGHTPGTGNAQDTTSNLFGKMLRIDVNGDDFPGDTPAALANNYAIPPTNPLVGETGDDEIWAYGLRNPFRDSFDRATGDLWIGDVGQGQREEIDFQAAGFEGGANYGWRLREGSIQTPGVGGPVPPGYVPPVYDYNRDNDQFGGTVVSGGYVYRGPDPTLQGKYFFLDSRNTATVSDDNYWMFDPANPYGTVANIDSLLTPNTGAPQFPVSFGEDASGNLYITYIVTGDVYRINTNQLTPADFDADADADGGDFLRWQRNFGKSSGAVFADGDADGDGEVDGDDLTVWQREFGYTALNAGAAVAVPEPHALWLASVAAAAAALGCFGRPIRANGRALHEASRSRWHGTVAMQGHYRRG